jgi:hypothetical protein
VGLLMAGGEGSFGAGGWAAAPLAEVLPVRVDVEGGFIERALALRPTALGLRSRVMQLGEDAAATQAAWGGVPALDWANRLGAVKPTAEVLATADGDVPLLVTGRFGGGRTAALAAGSTWRWQLGGTEQPPGAHFRRFWRQLVLYLTGRTARDVWVATDLKRYSLADLGAGRRKVRVTAAVSDRSGEAASGAAVALEHVGPQGRSRAVPLELRGDRYAAELTADEPGLHRLRLTAHRGGELLGEAATHFIVHEPHVEWEQPLADRGLLSEVARLSGGRVVEPEAFPVVLEELAARPMASRVTVEHRRSLWDNRLVLGAFAGLMAAEWIVRRRLGLI